MKPDTVRLKKLLLLALPYLLVGLICTNLGQAWRMAEGTDVSEKLLSFFTTVGIAFRNPLPSIHPIDLMVGLICGAGLRAAVYLRGRNAKHLSAEYTEVLGAKRRAYAEYRQAKNEARELLIARKNISSLYEAERKESGQDRQIKEQSR